METDGINALNPAPNVGGVLPPQINRPKPVIDYLTRPMVPSPKSRRRDTLKGIAQFLPFISGELAKAEGDKLGVALSGLDFLGAAGAPAKAAIKKGIDAIPDQATKNFSDAMKSKNLMFVHNTSEEAIRSFDAMGGLPSPSLAVTESEIPLKGFGKIQLIGKPEKFDPAIDPRNKVYSADAYTPRAPKKLRLAKEGAESKLTKEYESLAKEYGELDQLEQGQYALRNLQKDNMYYPENRLDELDRFFDSNLAKIKFMQEKVGNLDDFFGPALNQEFFKYQRDFNKWMKKEKNKYLSQNGVLQYFDDFEETMVTKPYTLENAVNSMIKETQRGGEGFAGGYSPARMKALMSKEFKDLPDIKAERGRLIDKPPSAMDLGIQIDELLAKYKFPATLDAKLTPKGSFYDENVGSNMLNDIGIAIEDGKKFDQKLLKDVYNQNIDFDDLEKFTRNKFEYDNPPKGFLDDLEDLFIKNATRNVEYFEAKPIRAVGFDEFAGAIVPKDTSQDVINILQKRGLKVIKQTDDDFTEDFFKTGARKQYFQDQMFSFAPIAGAGGVAALSIEKNTEDEDKGLGSL
tara:strand:- start:8835 stop:10556 length:1722 start_codon:yes stop_codon:yes gene_type:complete